MRTAAVDFFCGAGGLTYGLEETGIDVIAGIDIDPEARFPYQANTGAKFIQKDVGGLLGNESNADIDSLRMEEVEDFYPDDSISVLVGCAPCQPFSDLNNGVVNSDHEKWGLLEAIRRVSEELEPDIVAIENVKGLADDEIYTEGFREWFEQHDEYNIWDDIIDCRDYLVPQSRRRLIMLASRLGDIELIPPTRSPDDIVTVRRAFADADLPEIGAGEVASDVDPLHKAAGLRGKNSERMRYTKGGEDWHDWPDRLKLDSQDENNSFTAYGRMWWDKSAPTLTTQFYNWGSGRFGHPGYDEEPAESTDRAISLREGAILQTFPKDYRFVQRGENPVNDTIGRLIGNAVPVRVGNAIGGSIRRHLDQLGVDVEDGGPHENKTRDDSLSSSEVLVPPPVLEDQSRSIDFLEQSTDATRVR